MRMTKRQVLDTAHRIVRHWVDRNATVNAGGVHYLHYRHAHDEHRTQRTLSFEQCKQLVEEMS